MTDASETTPAEVSVTGSLTRVIDAIEQLKARGLLSPEVSTRVLSSSSPTHGSIRKPVPPTDLSQKQIEAALSDGQELLDRSRTLLAHPSGDATEAQALARQALHRFRSALDWAEDTDREDEAHQAMDTAGQWTCETFGCELEYAKGSYYRTCPVDLGHNRLGFSVGGISTRICSLCDLDFSECEHDPSRRVPHTRQQQPPRVLPNLSGTELLRAPSAPSIPRPSRFHHH